MTKNSTGTSWNYSSPSSWIAVEANAVSATGCTYVLQIKMGTSSSTWRLELNNNVFGTGY